MTPTETLATLSELYHTDETAWLERMAALAAGGQTAALDLKHLADRWAANEKDVRNGPFRSAHPGRKD
jgi:hypothetical protein